MTSESVLARYFQDTSSDTIRKLNILEELYKDWNTMINVISRKDIGNFNLHHLLHSLSIAKFISFRPGTRVLDAGTGGGLPGIPLAIMFPDVSFTLADSIRKKINVVSEIARSAGILNIKPKVTRVEEMNEKFDFIISRAVTSFPSFVKLTAHLISAESINYRENGIIYLKGGDLSRELGLYLNKVEVISISEYFTEEFFKEKKLIYLAGRDA